MKYIMYEIGRPAAVAEKIRHKEMRPLGQPTSQEISILEAARTYIALAVDNFKESPAVEVSVDSAVKTDGTFTFSLWVKPLDHFVA